MPQMASSRITGFSAWPYSVSSYTWDAAGGGRRRFATIPHASRSFSREERMFVPIFGRFAVRSV